VTLPGSTGTDQQQAVAVDGSGDVMTAWAAFAGKNESRHILQAQFRAHGKTFQQPVTLSTAKGYADDPGVAFDRFGDAIVVWHQFHGTDILYAAVRPRGGHFGASVPISRAGVAANNPQIAFDRAGDAFVLWNATERTGSHRHLVQVAIRPVHGRFGAPVTVSAGTGGVDSPRLAVNDAGVAVAVWRRCNNDVFGCDNGGSYMVQAAIRPAGGTFGAPANLSTPGHDGENPQVAIDSAGSAVAVWDRSDGSNNIVESARRAPGSGFGSLIDLATGAQNPQVAMDEHGGTLVAWELEDADSDNGGSTVQVASASDGGAFGAPQNLTGVETEANLALSMNPAGDAVAAWQYCTIGQIPCNHFVIQAAVRRPGSTFGPRAVISPASQDVFFPGLAINPDGDALAIWWRDKSDIGSGGVAEYQFG
jgi:hypothetical protein